MFHIKPPVRSEWSVILRGATFSEMTDTMKIAKRPVFIGGGGKIINKDAGPENINQYGKEPAPTDISPAVLKYMSSLEDELYDSLLKPGIQVQRVGTDVVLLLTRDSFMYWDAPEISDDGEDTLKIVTKNTEKNTMLHLWKFLVIRMQQWTRMRHRRFRWIWHNGLEFSWQLMI